MNNDEVTIVLEIIMTACGGNAEVVYDLCLQFIEEFPLFETLTKEIFYGIYGNYESFDVIGQRLCR